jgi:glutamyl-tRNA synthetase
LQYREEGYLPEAVFNYLARLGWAHGNQEIFSREQFIAWFDLEHLGKSPAQHNPEKLAWLNNHYIKQADNQRLVELVKPFLEAMGVAWQGGPLLTGIVALFKDRARTVKEIAQHAATFYLEPRPAPDLLAQHITVTVKPALTELAETLHNVPWRREAISTAFKAIIAKYSLKMPQLAMPVRLLTVGQSQTPAIDAILELLGRKTTLKRLENYKIM